MITTKPKSVLDIGCSNGTFLDYAKRELGAHYSVGVEFDEELICEAKTKADEIIKSDLNLFEASALGGRHFDLVVLADVLEHVKEPADVLREVLKSTTDDVQVIISLPNIQHWTAIKNLIIGIWPQRDRGLFDKTHLRFFTLSSINTLVAECELQIEAIHRNLRIVDAPNSRINRYSRFFRRTPLAPYFTYQYVLRLRRL